ncbi:MAG TPA: thioredoxin domain-containing protein [Thermomicrobiales bacterium]|nr:thioredoxin domain-containing protein [Thermomicrobiales bacterium]
MPNRLAAESSPYLLQHQDNPVDWYPWGDEALAIARQRDVPILLSIGYSACHWCHVMAHQSFENESIAQYMNEHFMSIKVDREERPEIDAIYMSALQSMTGQGGWPLNIFLTPDGEPFFGGTYWPPVDTGGMPGFRRVLEAIDHQWRTNRPSIDSATSRVMEVLHQSTAFIPTRQVALEGISEAAVTVLEHQSDPVNGGFGAAPKFPQASILNFLLRHVRRTDDEEALSICTSMLDGMSNGGIHDQLGGGFSRYSVDADWLVPHFEKMLYDNAQLLQIYLDAWRLTGNVDYRTVADGISSWLLREMEAPEGGFFSALDADSEGHEGTFYIWTNAELDECLDPDLADLARLHFGVTPTGNFEGRTVLSIERSATELAEATGRTLAEVETDIAAIREILWNVREKRIRPATDTKVIVSWNGLAIGALADAGVSLGNVDYLNSATRAAKRIVVRSLSASEDLPRVCGPEGGSGTGVLEDHAFLAHGLLRLHAATGEFAWLEAARALADRILTSFRADIGFWDTSIRHQDLIVRPRDLQDGATPSGNSVALDVLLTLADLTMDDRYREPVEPLLTAMSVAMAEHPTAFGYLLSVLERCQADHRQVVLAGSVGAEPLVKVLFARFEPFLSIGWVQESNDAGQGWPLLADRSIPAGATGAAYLCQGMSCLPPIISPLELQTLLGERT